MNIINFIHLMQANVSSVFALRNITGLNKYVYVLLGLHRCTHSEARDFQDDDVVMVVWCLGSRPYSQDNNVLLACEFPL